jgi:hypothetical protein
MIHRIKRVPAKKQLATIFLGMAMILSLASSPMAVEPASPPGPKLETRMDPGQCSEIVALLTEQDLKYKREFLQLKRDIAALTQQVAEPGINEILGGIGYILGLFGVAAYFASRKKVGKGGN